MITTAELQALLVRLGVPLLGDRVAVELDAYVAHALVTELLFYRGVATAASRPCYGCWRLFVPPTPDVIHCARCCADHAARETRA